MKNITRVLVFFFAVATAASASAAEITILCSTGFSAVVEDLVPKFENATGNKVLVKYEPSSQLKKRIDAGEPFDLAILTTAVLDDEIKDGKLTSDSRTVLARTGLGLSIRSGAKKPNITTVGKFRNALLEAESITYAAQGASAQMFEVVVARLGITAQLKPKYNPRNTGSEVGDAVSSGIVELGVAPISEILPVRGVDLVGPFPKEIQVYVETTGAISVSARQQDEAKKLLAFLIAPANAAVVKAKGMER